MRPTDLKRHRVSLAWVVAAVLLLSACSPASEQATPDPEPTESAGQAEVNGATCAAHGAPTELCFICDASLRDAGRLWCREHSRYEDRCWECHPRLQDENRLWCKEHSLYEDECFLCHPELFGEHSEPAEGAAGPSTNSEAIEPALMCNEHGVPEQDCGICHPELLAQDSPRQGLKVRLPSAASATKAGVVVGTPDVQQMEDGVGCFAELAFNQNKLARITSLVGGVVKRIEVDLGSRVDQGDLLATITSATIGEAQSTYLRALAEDELSAKTLERERGLLAQRISSEKEYEEAEAAHHASAAAVRQAQQQLLVFGFDETRIQALAGQQSTPGVLELRAPFGGEIVERTAVQGAVVEVTDVLFTLADTSVFWAMLNIPESQLSGVNLGQAVELTVESLPGHAFVGTLTWLSATLDKRTRMARGRAEVTNTGGRLKAQMFAHARIATAHSDRAVVVPLSAVQNVTGTPVVFVKVSDDLFEVRPVTLGVKHDGRVEIAAGLRPDEAVVVAGGFALKSQLLASRLGAGCVDE
ncbi:MAG: efflux RND transporter periplasmic adaptor subunit [Deltaproteobacteria bacterium]|nr:efflux RND transporter periplasmic adaptor subunit [Deltaproteobacteria bacterium]